MSDLTYYHYYQKYRDVILNRAKDYYENDKERLKKSMEKTDTIICLKKRNKV